MSHLAAVSRGLRHRFGADVRPITLATLNRVDLLPTYLQAGADVHGSHSLFYWLRARGRGHIVSRDNAAMGLAWRDDVGRLIAIRPVGPLEAVMRLLDAAAQAVTDLAGPPLVVRYCSPAVAGLLRDQGWTQMSSPWHADAPADDETHPEVIVTAPAVEMPGGRKYKPLREAVFRHASRYQYTARPTPLGIGETTLIHAEAARADDYDQHELGFNDAVTASLASHHHDRLTYHYLTRRDRLAAFAITADITGVAHGYYLAARSEPRLVTYFLWLIYLQQRRVGASALNLGGSETRSLFEFKTHTFPDHIQQRTCLLQSPHVPH
ncbi:hypothetical protein [Nonomuraea basaltis]|uniref:hypothetical protein n=1 Tax=Nonomuraea basaltis TaxID=2495887 RepID=UPI00110C5C42|nr:hypothetical protein [Nonomuraea basaltis]TMR90372.1 hypothetical protein EJK15_55705 [Nonomuraea basaltis]